MDDATGNPDAGSDIAPDSGQDSGAGSGATAPVSVVFDGAVVHVRLNRPERRNALNDAIRVIIAELLDELIERPDVRVLVLSGEGASFCAGADITTTSYPPVEGTWSTRRNRTSTWQRVLEQLDRIPQVTIASMHGHAVGGGALLATACDFRVVTDDIVFRIPEVTMGIPNVWNGTPLVAREVGLPTTRDWVMTGRAVDADELVRAGWAQRCVSASELDAATEELVDQLLAQPPGALAMTRSMLSALGRGHSGMQLGWADADLQQWAFTEAEYQETVRGYVRGVGSRRSDSPSTPDS